MDISEYRVGLACFRGEVQLSPLQKQMAEGYDGKLTVDWGDYQKHWNQLAHKIKQITATTMLIWNNRCPSILFELSHISFPNLTLLVVRGNHIVSVENIIKVEWPQLKELDISDNLLVSTRSFAKMNLRNLERLDLCHNPVVNNDDLYKANFSRVQKIDISTNQVLKNIFGITTDPVTWKIKLQSSLEGDRNYYNHYSVNRPMRGPRGRMAHHNLPIIDFDYSQIRQMLKEKRSPER